MLVSSETIELFTDTTASELIRFKEYYGMTKRHEHDPMYSRGIYARFSGNFSEHFPRIRLQWEKRSLYRAWV